MHYTGFDLHRKTSFIKTVDSNGQIVKKSNTFNDETMILEYFLGLDQDTKVVIESTANWYWLYDLLTVHSIPAVVSNPVKTKAKCPQGVGEIQVSNSIYLMILSGFRMAR